MGLLMLSWWNKISFCKETKCIVILLSVELWKNRAKWWESSPGKVKIIAFVPRRYRALFFVPLSKKGGLVIFKQQDTHRAFFLSSQKTFKDRNHLKNAKNISHIFIPLHSFLICCFDSCVFKLETVSEGVSHRSISSDISYSYARLYREIHTLKRFAFFD